MLTWKRKSSLVSSARLIRRHPRWPPFTPGSFQQGRGLGYTSILLDHSWENCSWFWWTPTQSGWKWQWSLPVRPPPHTIRFLRNIFAIHGTPDLIVSDNGTAFSSEEFQSFLKRNNIRHTTSAPYHPSSNGMASWGWQNVTFKLLRRHSGNLKETSRHAWLGFCSCTALPPSLLRGSAQRSYFWSEAPFSPRCPAPRPVGESGLRAATAKGNSRSPLPSP